MPCDGADTSSSGFDFDHLCSAFWAYYEESLAAAVPQFALSTNQSAPWEGCSVATSEWKSIMEWHSALEAV